ncbi:MAG: sulfurtransferase TusA family protein, partial [Candidatus Melainabacteria bacterium]|nr:sulfurtransferase TusA family protein [Candidatus Melainabacteria bacterium]
MLTRVDLRGLICPEPVLKVKKLTDDPQLTEIEALVDDDVCVNNLRRLAKSLKATAEVQDKNGYYIVTIKLKENIMLQP